MHANTNTELVRKQIRHMHAKPNTKLSRKYKYKKTSQVAKYKYKDNYTMHSISPIYLQPKRSFGFVQNISMRPMNVGLPIS